MYEDSIVLLLVATNGGTHTRSSTSRALSTESTIETFLNALVFHPSYARSERCKPVAF